MTDHQTVLDYWLADSALSPEHTQQQKKLWYRSSQAIDDEIEAQFAELHAKAVRGKLDEWRTQAFSALALVILLDQFTRHLYRGTAQAFSQDSLALDVARNCPGIESLPVIGQVFLLHPFEHSEDIAVQAESVKRFTHLSENAGAEWQPTVNEFLKHAIEHHDIVKRFGRFPHRNAVMGRTSTSTEVEYLAQGGKSFGQKPKNQ